MKLNGKEKRWILYDVGNSAFVLLVATIIPIYFNYLADFRTLIISLIGDMQLPYVL